MSKDFSKDYSKQFFAVIVICSVLLIAIFVGLTAQPSAKLETYFPEYRSRIVDNAGYKCIQFTIFNRENNTVTDGFILVEGVNATTSETKE